MLIFYAQSMLMINNMKNIIGQTTTTLGRLAIASVEPKRRVEGRDLA